MRYYITIQKKLFGFIPWTTTKKARNPEHAAEILTEIFGCPVRPKDVHLFLRKPIHLSGSKIATLHQ